jgi:type III pantothenate kinase
MQSERQMRLSLLPMKDIIHCIDAGNTAIKLGVFENGVLIENHRFDDRESLFSSLSKDAVIALASVRDTSFTHKLAEQFNVSVLDNTLRTPFQNHYQSAGLGMDRLCNVAGMYAQLSSEQNNGLSIDIGTCIKFDLLDGKRGYLGGSISPGVRMQLKAMNEHTANLPLLEFPKESPSLYGNTTELSMLSGVIGNLKGEIAWRIAQYEHEFPNLNIYVSGGDASYFDLAQKNNIFADENLTLKGIHEIYKFNA